MIIRNKSLPAKQKQSKPAKWRDVLIDEIQRWSSIGLTQREIAKGLGIHLCTLEYWIRTKPKLREALKRGAEEANENVKKSLYQLATGYSHKDTQFFMYKGQIVSQEYTKQYPPNAFAAWKWLTIRDRANWMDVQKSELTVNLNQPIDFSDFSDEELLTLEKMGMKHLMENATNNPN